MKTLAQLEIEVSQLESEFERMTKKQKVYARKQLVDTQRERNSAKLQLQIVAAAYKRSLKGELGDRAKWLALASQDRATVIKDRARIEVELRKQNLESADQADYKSLNRLEGELAIAIGDYRAMCEETLAIEDYAKKRIS